MFRLTFLLLLIPCLTLKAQTTACSDTFKLDSTYTIRLLDGPRVTGKLIAIDSTSLVLQTQAHPHVRIQCSRIARSATATGAPVEKPTGGELIMNGLDRAGNRLYNTLNPKVKNQCKNTVSGEVGISLFLVAIYATASYERRLLISEEERLQLRVRGGYGVAATWDMGEYRLFPAAATLLLGRSMLKAEISGGAMYAQGTGNDNRLVWPIAEAGFRIQPHRIGPFFKFKVGTTGTGIGTGFVF